MNSGAAMACAAAGAATMLSGHCAAQSFVAADYATNSTYAGGWAAGQNGGHGFGAWSFNATDNTPAGQYQGMSTSSAVGTAWTLLVQSSSGGLANAGRSIPGGLQVGQTFQTIIQNPVTWAGQYSYRGFDMLFTSGPDNKIGGDNTAYHVPEGMMLAYGAGVTRDPSRKEVDVLDVAPSILANALGVEPAPSMRGIPSLFG